MICLHSRRTGPSATAAEVKRAHAHRLLDDVRAGNSQASEGEIWAALRLTGDALPLVRELHGVGLKHNNRPPAELGFFVGDHATSPARLPYRRGRG